MSSSKSSMPNNYFLKEMSLREKRLKIQKINKRIIYTKKPKNKFKYKGEHNRLTSGKVLSNNRRAVGFVSSLPRFSEASLSLIRLCNSSFLALLVNKSNRKQISKLAKHFKIYKSFQISQKCSKLFSVSGVKSSNPSARLEKLRWPVMIVKLKKGQIFKKFENNPKF